MITLEPPTNYVLDKGAITIKLVQSDGHEARRDGIGEGVTPNPYSDLGTDMTGFFF
jgi:hypothetical protein